MADVASNIAIFDRQVLTMALSNIRSFRFSYPLRVRWAKVDMQKIVFNANYLMYIDTAIAAYWRALALPYETTMQMLQGDLYVKKATLEFHKSAQVDDQLEVALQCSRIGTSSMTFVAAIFRGDQRVVTGELVYVFADPVAQTSKPVPVSFRNILLAFEGGEAMIRVELGDWQAIGVEAAEVRREVFIEEQHIPIEMERDLADDGAIHALARNRLGLPVATGRLLQRAPGVGQIGRMAVNRALRGANLGRDVLQLLLQAATERGDHEVMLHAQRSAKGFYSRLGFVTRGDPFEEAGIEHIEMVCPIPP